MNIAFLNLRSCLLVSFFALSLLACERDQVNTEVVAIYPAAGRVVPGRDLTFKWIGNGYEKYHFRFGNADLSKVLVDSILTGTSFQLTEWLPPGEFYRYEVSQGQALVSVPFRTESTPILELLSPAPSSTLPMYGAEFKWHCNAPGPYRFKLIKERDGMVVVDTATVASGYVLHHYLDPSESYKWKVSRAGVAAEATVQSSSAALLTLLSPTAGDVVQVCCGLVFRWSTVLPPPYRLVVSKTGATNPVLDIMAQDTEFVCNYGFLPAANHTWRVEVGNTTANDNFDVERLEQMWPNPITGTTTTTHYDETNGFSTTTSPGSITLSTASDNSSAVIGNGALIPRSFNNGSYVEFYTGDSNNYQRLQVYYDPPQVIYTFRTGGIGVWDEVRFVGQ